MKYSNLLSTRKSIRMGKCFAIYAVINQRNHSLWKDTWRRSIVLEQYSSAISVIIKLEVRAGEAIWEITLQGTQRSNLSCVTNVILPVTWRARWTCTWRDTREIQNIFVMNAITRAMTLVTLPAISKWSTARWSWNVRNVILPPNPEGAWGNTRGSTQLVWLAQCVDFRQTPNKVSEYTKPLTTEERIRQFRFYFWWCHEPRAQSWVVYSLYGWKIWLHLTALYNIDNKHAHHCSYIKETCGSETYFLVPRFFFLNNAMARMFKCNIFPIIDSILDP